MQRHGLDALIIVAAIESALEVVFRHDAELAPRTSPGFAAPAIAPALLPLLARRRYPFGAPAVVFALCAALSLVDGRLVVFPAGVFVGAMAGPPLLRRLPDHNRARRRGG